MIQENILRFITEANLGGINAINNALNQQAQRLRQLAAESARYNARAGRFTNQAGQFMSRAQVDQQLNQAVNMRARIADIFRSFRNIRIDSSFLNQFGRNVGQIAQSIVGRITNLAQQIREKLTLGGLARSALGEAGKIAGTIRGAIPGAARTAGAAITSAITGALRVAHAMAGRVVGAIRGIGRGISGAGVGAAIGIGFGFKASAAIDAQLAIINTIARTSEQVLDRIAFSLTKTARDTGTNIADLTAGLYDLLSAGLGVEDMATGNIAPAMELMNAASYLAVGGLGTVTESIDFLTSVINSFRGPLEEQFGNPLLGATTIVDAFSKAIEIGKFTAADLGTALAIVAPLASQLGVDFREVAAFLAAMTQQGFTASRALTTMRSAMVGLQRNSGLLEDSLENLNVQRAFDRVGAKSWLEYLDIAGFQQMAITLRRYSDESGVPLIKLLGRIEGVQAVLGVTASQAANYADILIQVSNAEGTAARQAELANNALIPQARLFKEALVGLADVLFRRRLVDPVRDLVRFLREGVDALIVLTQNPAVKAFLDMAVPLTAIAAGFFALTRGADALNHIFIRLGGPIAGVGVGISGIAHTIAFIATPLLLAIALFKGLEHGVSSGILPLETFGPLLHSIHTVLSGIGEVGQGAVAVVRGVANAIRTHWSDPELLRAGIRNALTNAAAIFKNAGRYFTAGGAGLSAAINNIFESGFADAAQENLRIIREELWTAFQQAFDYLAPRLGNLLIGLFNRTLSVALTAIQWGADFADTLIDNISSSLPKLAAFIRSIPARLTESLAGGELGGFRDTAQTMIDSLVRWLNEDLPRLTDGIKEVLSAAWDLAWTYLPSLVDMIIDWATAHPFAAAGAVIGAAIAGPVGIALGAVLGDMLGSVLPDVIANLPDFGNAIYEAIVDALPEGQEFASGIVTMLGDAIPDVLAGIADFFRTIFRELTAFGNDDGPIGNAMVQMASALIGWIVAAIPDAVAALGQFVTALSFWIITEGLPRLARTMIALGIQAVKALLDGFLDFLAHPLDFVANAAAILAGLFSAALALTVVNAAFALAGAAKAVVFWLAFRTASLAGNLLVSAFGSLIIPDAAFTAAGAKAALSFRTAFLLGLAGLALLAVTLVADEIKKGWATQTEAIVLSVQTQIELGAPTADLEKSAAALRTGLADIMASTRNQFTGEGIPLFEWMTADTRSEMERAIKFIEDELAKRRAEWQRRINQSLGLSAFDPASLKEGGTFAAEVNRQIEEASRLAPIAKALGKDISDPIVTGMADAVDSVNGGTRTIVDRITNMPTLLEAAAEAVREAIRKPFKLGPIVKQFEADYQLILQAQASGNPIAIAQANVLKAAMVQSANDINAAYIAAGKAPPFLVDAITGQVTPAATAAKAMRNAVRSPLGSLEGDFKDAGGAAKQVSRGIRNRIGDTRTAAQNLKNAASAPFKPAQYTGQFFGWGNRVGGAWVNGVISAVGGPNVAFRIRRAIAGSMSGPLAGNSPPREGPLRFIDLWGFNIGTAWVDGIVTAIEDAPTRVANSMRRVASQMATALPGPRVMATLVGANASGLLTPTPVPAGALGGGTAGTDGAGRAGAIISPTIHVDARGAENPRAVEFSARRGVRQALADGMADILREEDHRFVGGRRPGG